MLAQGQWQGLRQLDVFYVTDLMGSKIASPTRQAAIKRALLQLLGAPGAVAGEPPRTAVR